MRSLLFLAGGAALAFPLSAEPLFDPAAMKNSHRFFLTGELLVWRASEDHLAFAVTSTNGGRRATIKDLHFAWDPGLRVGLGWRTAHDQWDLYGAYTHIVSHAHGRAAGTVSPVWQTPFLSPIGGIAESAHARLKVFFNMGDVELGRNCRVANWLSIRPFIGLKGGTIEQKYRINYTGGTAVPLGEVDALHLNNDFWGVGIRMGFNSLWGFGKGLGLYGNGAFGALSGNFHVREKEELRVSRQLIMKITDHSSPLIALAELALGLQWDRFFSENRYHLGLRAGFEMQIYTNQNQFFRFISTTSPGLFTRSNSDLAFMGASIGFRFDF